MFKYKGTDLKEIFDGDGTGTISGINFSPFPKFNTTNNVNERYKTNEIKLLGESFKTANQDILTEARNFRVTKSFLQNTDGELTMPPWANAVKIRVTGVKGGIGDKGIKGEEGIKGESGIKGEQGPQGDKGDTGGKGKDEHYKCPHRVTIEEHNGGPGGPGGDGGAGGNGGNGGNGGPGGDGGDGGAGGEGGNGGVNIFEDVFTVLNDNTIFKFEAGNNEDHTTLSAHVNNEEKLLIKLSKGAKGQPGRKGYIGAKGITGLKGLKGNPGGKGAKGYSGQAAFIGQHKVGTIGQQQCNDGRDGGGGGKGAAGADDKTTRDGIPEDTPAKNTAAGPSPDTALKGIKGAVTAYTANGTKTAGDTNINGLSFTNIQSTPSVELSFFVVDDTEN